MKLDSRMSQRLFQYAVRSMRHDSSPNYIVVAAWIDRKNNIISARCNHLIASQIRGIHAEEACLRCIPKTDTMVVARFNVRNVLAGRAKASMAKPCEQCSKLVCSVEHLYYTDHSGIWNKFVHNL